MLYMVTFTINIPPMLAYIYTIHGSYGYVQTNTWTFMTPKTGRDSVSRAIQEILTGCLRAASCKRTLESPNLNDASGTLHPPNLRKKPTVDGESPTEQAWLGLRLGLGTPSG